MAVRDFALPDLGEGLTESELVSWRVAIGDAVELNQIIAEVETAKALVELPSPFAGTIAQLYAEPGTTVQVGSRIAAFEVSDGAGVSDATTDAAADAAVEREPVLVGYGPPVEGGARPARKARVFDGAPTPRITPAETPSRNPRSTPPVRKLARDLGVELTDLTGTGDGGLITREDVERAAHASAMPQPTPAGNRAGDRARETRIPIRSVRKHTAAAMVSSAFTAPHVSEFLTVDVTPTMELIAKLKASREFAGLRVNLLTVVAKALCIAVARTPSVNSHWDDAAQEIVEFGYVNLGIAAATPRGLVVPNVKDADRLSLAQLAEALSGLVETARAGKASPADLGGGTISITNIGVFGIDAGTPILNPGEAMILAMGAVKRMPWEFRDEIALRQVVTLSASFDHRLVDGEQGSKFLADVGAILSDPGMLLTMV
ncbi:dihydrolipoamide acetyltransferase family protein [Parafrigoribacterium humi]|jgi:pyruvate dehydrogenase E2 component (dihydrolipoamide acetyltransferase)|uniref:dihydrolipoamide acetyltransferase family protein n=1 Tax=Parafrigoribacterium humi TaxID=3144664 RepID=UPI0032F007A4